MVQWLLAGLLFVFSIPAYQSYISYVNPSEIVISEQDPGGDVEDHIKFFHYVKDAGIKIRVAGECVSACTLMLGILPRDKICIDEEKGSFGFHLARTSSEGDVELTNRLDRMFYPTVVNTWLKAHGPQTLEVQYMMPEDFKGYLHYCGKDKVADFGDWLYSLI